MKADRVVIVFLSIFVIIIITLITIVYKQECETDYGSRVALCK